MTQRSSQNERKRATAAPTINPRAQPQIRRTLSPEWQWLWDRLSAAARARLGSFVRMCAAEVASPNGVRDTNVIAWHEDKLQSTTAIAARSAVNSALKDWNTVKSTPEMPLASLTPISNRADRRAQQIGRFNPALRQEIDEHLSALKEPVDKATLRAMRNRLFDAADVLAEQGKIYGSFVEMANDGDLHQFVRAPRFGDVEAASSRRNGVLAGVRRLLEERFPDDAAADLVGEQLDVLPKVDMAVPENTQLKLANFDSPHLLDQLLSICVEAVEALQAIPGSVTLASRRTPIASAQAGLGALVILGSAARREEIESAAFSGPVRASGVCRPSLVITLGGETHNIDEDPKLSPELSPLLDLYWVFVDKHFHRPKYLFESSTGKRRDGPKISVLIAELTAKIGVSLSPSNLRDLSMRQLMQETTLSDEDLKDVVRYSQTDNFRYRFGVFREEQAAQRFTVRLIKQKKESEE
ncbi:MAG: hypothetical protein ACLPID_21165 [Beijerinckiaceae bacterium]